MTSEELRQVEHQIIGEIWASGEMWETMKALCFRWPNRFAGTPGEREAAEFLLQKMEEYGLHDVHIEEFPYSGWRRGEEPVLKVISPVERVFPCVSMPYSPAGDVTGGLVDLGAGTPEDFELHKEDLAGNIALITISSPAYKPPISVGERMRRAAAAGAQAVVWRGRTGGFLAPGGTLNYGGPAPIPGVGIAKEDAFALEHFAREGPLRLHLVTHDQNLPMVGYNVIGEISGLKQPEKVLIASAHYDSIELSPGANDNAAGVAAILGIARVFSSKRRALGKTIRFAFFSAEELGLIGSKRYVEAHRTELDGIEVIINLDDPAGAIENGLAIQGWPELVPYLRALRQEMHDDFPIEVYMKTASDHYPFALAGVPAISIDPLGRPTSGLEFGHTPAETPDKVSLLKMRLMSIMIARLLLRLANRDDWPATRRSRQEILGFLERQGLRESLEGAGRWPEGE